jgi:hypothetical protein
MNVTRPELLRSSRAGIVLGVLVVMMMMVMVVVVIGFGEGRTGKHHQEQCGCENFLHGENVT